MKSKVHSLSSEQLTYIHHTLIKKPDIRYEYKVDILNMKHCVLTSESYPSLQATFILIKEEQWIIKDILYVFQKRLKFED